MSAVPGDVFPRVRRNLRYLRQVKAGKTIYIVKDPIGLRYFRFGEVEAWLMQRMDGAHSLGELGASLQRELGVQASAESLEPFCRRLKELGLAERTQAERSVLVLEAVRRQRRSRTAVRGNTLLRMRFSLGDPDELFDRMVDHLRFFWTPGFVVLSLAAFLVYTLIMAMHWGAFTEGIAALYDPSHYTAGFVVTFYLSAVVIIAIHELGHGLTCKHFGGEVHEIGAMLLYFSPAFFCNVNDAWTFERRAHRLWVSFAGGWVQLWIASVAALVWIAVTPHTWLHQLAFVAVLIGGGLSLLLNYNPLIPLDGYYALMDWLEIPNLRPRSFEYLTACFKRRVLRMDVPLPIVTPRERRTFLLYGTLAFAYTVLILALLGSWIGALAVRKWGAWGWAIAALLGWVLARKPLQRMVRVARVWAAGRRADLRARRRAGAVAGGLAILALLTLLVPWTIRVRGSVVVEPTHRVWLRPADDGWVEAVRVAEGAVVRAGDPVLVLRNPELEVAWAHARGEVARLEQRTTAARSSGRTAEARQLERQLEARRADFASLDRRRSALTLRAPFAARVATSRPEELLGARPARGDSLIELWPVGSLRARVSLAERDAGEIGVGAPAGLKFPVRPGWTWRTRVERISPAARQGEIELLAPLHASATLSPLRPGMVGRAKVTVERTTLARAIARGIRRTFRADLFL